MVEIENFENIDKKLSALFSQIDKFPFFINDEDCVIFKKLYNEILEDFSVIKEKGKNSKKSELKNFFLLTDESPEDVNYFEEAKLFPSLEALLEKAEKDQCVSKITIEKTRFIVSRLDSDF